MVSELRHDAPNGSQVPELPSGRFPRTDLLEGRFVKLVPLDPEQHAADLFAASHAVAGTETIWDYLPYGPFADSEQYQSWLRASAASSDPLFFTMCDLSSGKALGLASYLNIVPLQGVIEVGHIMLGIDLQKTTAATEALFLMFAYAMDELGYRRLEWKCNALNARSRQAAVRYGFRYEGTFYNHVIVKGHNRDTAWYSIIDREWPEIRSAFQTWLEPTNFDSQGNQRVALSVLTASVRNRSR